MLLKVLVLIFFVIQVKCSEDCKIFKQGECTEPCVFQNNMCYSPCSKVCRDIGMKSVICAHLKELMTCGSYIPKDDNENGTNSSNTFPSSTSTTAVPTDSYVEPDHASGIMPQTFMLVIFTLLSIFFYF